MVFIRAQQNLFSGQRARVVPGFVPPSYAEHVRQIAQELKLLASEVQLVEREIEEFNRYYYAEVGGLYEEFRRLSRPQQEAAAEEEGVILLQESEMRLEKGDPVVASLSKKLYRRMAKLCHPDSQESPAQQEIFVKLHDAYKAQDLGSLVLLEQQFKTGQKPASRKQLEEQTVLMEQARDALEERKSGLMSSPSYKLRQKIFWAKMGGQDLMAHIRHYLKRQIMLATVQKSSV